MSTEYEKDPAPVAGDGHILFHTFAEAIER